MSVRRRLRMASKLLAVRDAIVKEHDDR